MNPFNQAIVGSVARTLIAALAGAGLLADSEIERYSGALGVLLIGLWSIYQKYTSRQLALTLGASPKRMSEAEAKAQIAAGFAPTVFTAATDIPVVISASQ